MDDVLKRFFGGLLLAVGVLIGGLGGLCTLVFIGMSIVGEAGEHYPGAISNLLPTAILSLFVGAIPMGIGAGLFFLGRSLWRSAGPRKL